MATKEGVKILGIKWWHFIGGGGTIIGVLCAAVALWQHFDLKKHDERILAETKATIADNRSDIAINLPDVNIDVDGTAAAIGGAITAGREDVAELSGKVADAIGDTTTATTETIANYWEAKKDIFALPSVFGGDGDDPTEEEIRICEDTDMGDWLPPELWDDMCG